VPTRDIAEVISRHLSLPVVAALPGDAARHFTWLARFLALDIPVLSALTRELTAGSQRSSASSTTWRRATTSPRRDLQAGGAQRLGDTAGDQRRYPRAGTTTGTACC